MINFVAFWSRFLTDKQQRVIFKWKKIRAGIPQGWVFDLIVLFIYISDLPQGLHLPYVLVFEVTVCNTLIQKTNSFTAFPCRSTPFKNSFTPP